MASKSTSLRTKQGKISANDVLVTKRKQSKQSSLNKALTRRVSPVHKKNKTPREEHRSDSNEAGSLSYHRDINNSTGFISSNKQASPVIRNDITRRKRESRKKTEVQQVTMPAVSVDVSPKVPPANNRACASPQSISIMKASGEHPKSVLKAEAKYDNLDSVERRNVTPKHPLSAETEQYSSPAPTRNNSANILKDTSKSYSVTHRSIDSSVSNSAVHRTHFEARVSSASYRINAPSRSSSAIYSKGGPPRSYSAGFRTTKSPRSNFALFSSNTLSESSSSLKRLNTPRRKTVKFKRDEKVAEISEQVSWDQEIIEGKGIEIEANEDLESLMSEEITKDEEKIKKIEVFIRPSVPLPGDLPRRTREDLQSRGSSLMLGSGKTRRQNDTETLEIHFNNTDFSNLVTKSSPEMYCTTGNMNSDRAQNEGKHSPRHVEVQLPKTYITKSGSLFLYSDSTVMKGKQRDDSENSQGNGRSIEVFGRKMSPRTLVPQAYPYWGKLVKTKTGDKKNNTGYTRKDQRDYIGIKSQASTSHPYSWNYTVLPVKLITTDDEDDIKTVSNLTEAVLAYRSKSPTTEDKYLTMMKQAHDGKTLAERLTKRAEQLEHLSMWTHDWIKSQSSEILMEHNETENTLQHSDGKPRSNFIARLQHPIKKSLFCRTPANTPLVGSKQQDHQNEPGLLYQKKLL